MSKKLAVLFAMASGLAIGNLYWAQPLLAQITDSFGLEASRGGLLITATQIGYAVGILLIVPLGDILRRRRMIFILMLCSAGALAACAFAPSFAVLGLALASMGLVTVSGQVIVPLSGDLSKPEERGHIVGIVSSGITTGILLSRFISGIVAVMWGWRMIYVLSALLNLIMAFIIFRSLPEVQPKEKISYGSLLKGVFTAFARFPVLPRILLQTGMVFGIAFNLFWTAMTFLLSAAPFHYSTFQIGLLSLVGLTGAAAGVGLGKLQDKGVGIPALGIFVGAAVLCMIAAIFSGHSIIAIAVIGAIFSLAVQGISVLCQARLFTLSNTERSRLNTVFVVNNFIFAAVGSALASVLWNLGGWSAVSIGGAAASLIAFFVWLLSRKTFEVMDRQNAEIPITAHTKKLSPESLRIVKVS